MAYRRNQTLAMYWGVDFAGLQTDAQDCAFTAWQHQERLNGNDAHWNLYIAGKRIKWVLAGPILRHLGRLLRKLDSSRPELSEQITWGVIYHDESIFWADNLEEAKNQIAPDARIIAVWDHRSIEPELK